jgi:hypothetical protein
VIEQTIEGRAVMRAAPSGYVRFALICAMMFLPFVFILSQRPNVWFAWLAAAVVAALCVVFMVWVSRFRLEYGGNTIRYRTLFGGDVEIDVSTIASATPVMGVRTYSDRFRPRVRLELVAKPGAPWRMVPVNINIFRREEFAKFTAFLGQHVKMR